MAVPALFASTLGSSLAQGAGSFVAQGLGSLFGGSNYFGGGNGSAGVAGQGLQSVFGLNSLSNSFLADTINDIMQDDREVNALREAIRDSGTQRSMREAIHEDAENNLKSEKTMLQKTTQLSGG